MSMVALRDQKMDRREGGMGPQWCAPAIQPFFHTLKIHARAAAFVLGLSLRELLRCSYWSISLGEKDKCD
jgi:hypothetical protein